MKDVGKVNKTFQECDNKIRNKLSNSEELLPVNTEQHLDQGGDKIKPLVTGEKLDQMSKDCNEKMMEILSGNLTKDNFENEESDITDSKCNCWVRLFFILHF